MLWPRGEVMYPSKGWWLTSGRLLASSHHRVNISYIYSVFSSGTMGGFWPPPVAQEIAIECLRGRRDLLRIIVLCRLEHTILRLVLRNHRGWK